MAAQAALNADDIHVRVVSMPCMEVFEAQPKAYRDEVLGAGLPRIAIEAGVRFGWDRWIGADGSFIGMATFGASAPYQDLYQHFGITADAVAKTVKAAL